MPQTNINVKIENIAPEKSTFIMNSTGVGFDSGEFDTYEVGSSVVSELASLVENGETDKVSAKFIASDKLQSENGILSSSDFINADFTADNSNVANITVSTEEIFAVDGNKSEVYRFLESETQGEYYTTSEIEKDSLIKNEPNYELKESSFLSAPEPESLEDLDSITPVYRFISTDTGAYLYASSVDELAVMDKNFDYSFGGIAFYGYDIQQEGTVPVYGFYNSQLDANFYTVSIEERDSYLESSDFQAVGENGIVFYAEPVPEI